MSIPPSSPPFEGTREDRTALPELVRAAVSKLNILKWIAPLDDVAAELRTALVSGSSTVGPWRYRDVPVDAVRARLHDARRAVSAGAEPLREVLLDELTAADCALEAIAARDDERFAQWARNRYGTPRDSDVAEARALLDAPPADERAPVDFDAAEVAALTRDVLDRYGLDHWSVERAPIVATMTVNSHRAQVRVRADARFEPGDVDRLMVHEVGGHVLRAENARRQPYALAALALGNSIPTEEGVAAWLEEQFDVSRPAIRRRYAARLVAAHASVHSGVVDVARLLEPLVGLDQAIAISVRAKRGLIDPNGPGGFLKDQAYFVGLGAVRAHLTAFPEDLPWLLATRWPIERLPVVRQLAAEGVLLEAQLLPDPRLLGAR